LKTPLVNANPVTPGSSSSGKVYAIIPGYASPYAPLTAENGAGDPVVGQHVTIPAGVPGLPAGTYTLLPASYALLPGAYRGEIGKASTQIVAGPNPMGNGTYAISGATGIANTGIASVLPSLLLVTPGAGVRAYSQYNEEAYSDFLVANAGLFGSTFPLLAI